MKIALRKATTSDIPALRELIQVSVLRLQAGDYTRRQLEIALRTVFGVDTQLITDGTYFVAEVVDETADLATGGKTPRHRILAGAGGWSKRKTLFGGDHWRQREDELLDPRRDAAKIRAFYVHPDWARRGIGTQILEACERAAREAGFTSFEMGATLTGVPLYQARGYVTLEAVDVPLEGDETMRVVHMRKSDRKEPAS